jgi:hypothetical protein
MVADGLACLVISSPKFKIFSRHIIIALSELHLLRISWLFAERQVNVPDTVGKLYFLSHCHFIG